MPSLSSLIVERQVATIVEVEQAIARQVIHGGDLITNLLEVAPQCEPALTRVLGESLGMPCVPPGRLPAPDNEVLDLLPVDTALKAGVFPLRMAGNTLVLAASDRLPASVEHDLAYALGLDLTLVAAPLIRVREGIAAHYGIPLEPRQLRLVQKLDGQEVARASQRPRVAAQPADLPPSNLRSGVSDPPAARRNPTPVWRHGSAELAATQPGSMSRERDPASDDGRATDPEASPAPTLLADARRSVPPAPLMPRIYEATQEPRTELERITRPQPEPEEQAEAAPSTEPEPEPAPEPEPMLSPSPAPAGMVDRRAALRLIKQEISQKRRSVAKSARRKGPFSRVDAERELENAKSPEEVLDVFFAFGSQFFEYSALFVVHGDLAEGRDAWGPGADHLRVLGLGVPLDLPSTLAMLRKEGRVMLSKLDELDLDRELLSDLGRARERLTTAAFVPLTIRGRAVAMLYGDDGDADVSLANLGDLLGFSALASAQLEHLARLKKSRSSKFAGLVRPRAQSVNVSALARALSLPEEKLSSAPPPMSSSPPPPAAVAPMSGRASTLTGEGPVVAPPAADLSAPAPVVAPSPVDDGPRISPGAASVHPPPVKPDTTQPYEDKRHDDEPSRSPPPAALAPTVLADGWRAEASPVAVAAEVRVHEPPAVVATYGSEPPSSGDGPETPQRTPAPAFVRPIPRSDDDVSSVILAEVERDWGSSGSERYRIRQSDRVGTYHIVPRPADARARPSEPGSVDDLLERALMGGLEGEEATSELLRLAEHAFPQIVERFPGPLTVDRFKARADIPPASECGPLLKLLVMSRRTTLPFMTVKSASPEVEQRFWATHILGELLFPEASNAVLPRLFDDDVSVRRVARRAAQALVAAGAPGDPLRTSLDHTLRNPDEPLHRRLLAIEALSEIRVPAVVPILMAALRDPSEGIVEATRTALVVVTRQDLGRNPDIWDEWWQFHKGEHRIEWLIQALTHESPSIRRAAGDELKLVTREYFGYYDDLPSRERERAQDRYLAWWRDEGRYKFR